MIVQQYTYIPHTHAYSHKHTLHIHTHARTHACTQTHTHSEVNHCMLQVRLPTGTVILVEVGWLNYMNSVIYLSVADYGQTEGRDMNGRRY